MCFIWLITFGINRYKQIPTLPKGKPRNISKHVGIAVFQTFFYIVGTFKRRIGGYLALIYNKRPILLRQLRTCRGLVEEEYPDFRLNILLKIGRILLSGPRRV